MENKVKYIFITGLPKSGKTTLIKKIVSLYKSETVGFYTEEILDTKNERIGFKIVNTDGEEKIFAIKHNAKNVVFDYNLHKIKHYKKYDVFEDVLEKIAIEYIENFLAKDSKNFIIVIDEIGAMECMSEKFCNLVIKIINLKIPLIATLRYNTHHFVDDIKKIKDSKIFVLERKNQNYIFTEINQWIKSILFC